mgnify:FL=1
MSHPGFDGQIEQVRAALAGVFVLPDPRMPSEIASEHLYLDSRYSAVPGLVDFRSHPFLVEPLDCLHPDDPTSIIVVQGPVQSGKTIILQSALTYIMTTQPGPVLYVTDTGEKAEAFAKTRFDTMINNSPILALLTGKDAAGSKYNTVNHKAFRGGEIAIVGAQSASKLTSTTYRYGLVDEVDDHRADLSGAGSSISLVRARLTTYEGQNKMFLVSSPKVQDQSDIVTWRERGDDCRFVVPCPFCGELQALVFREQLEGGNHAFRLIWDPGDPSSVRYVCRYCEREIEENHKATMLPGGAWRATKSANFKGVRSFWYNSLYMPLGSLSWASLVVQWEGAVAAARSGDQKELKTFINTRLAEPYREIGEMLDTHALAQRVEPSWGPYIPDGVKVVVMGVDVQEDRLEAMTLGIGAGWETWILGYDVILSDPRMSDAWKQLLALHRKIWVTESGRELRSATTCVDAGFLMQQVLIFAKTYSRERILGIRGMARTGPIFPKKVSKTKKKRGEAPLSFYVVATTSAKNEIFSNLRVHSPGPLYVHIPEHVIDEHPTFLHQLTSEERVRDKKGKISWQKRSPSARNEALDTFVYCLAAGYSIVAEGVDFKEMLPEKVPEKKSLTPAPKTIRISRAPARQAPRPAPSRGDRYGGGHRW